jgi:hypothetical protein
VGTAQQGAPFFGVELAWFRGAQEVPQDFHEASGLSTWE